MRFDGINVRMSRSGGASLLVGGEGLLGRPVGLAVLDRGPWNPGVGTRGRHAPPQRTTDSLATRVAVGISTRRK